MTAHDFQPIEGVFALIGLLTVAILVVVGLIAIFDKLLD